MCAAIQQPSDPQDGASQLPQFACSSNGLLSAVVDDVGSPPMHASQHPQPPADDAAQAGHNIVAALTTQGIRVRDFAYENTLPPVTSVPRFSVQVQPRPRILKRTRDMLDGHHDGEESDEEDPGIARTWYIDSNGDGVSHAYRYRKKTATLERTLTEPVDEEPPSQGIHGRERYQLPPASPRPRAQCPATPQRPARNSQSQSPNRFVSPINTGLYSQPSAQDESQETEPWIDTPLVTPNGSLHWPVQDTSALPASQLESILPQLGDAEQNVTLSQLGFSPERSQATPVPSPAGTPSRVRRASPQMPPPAEFNTRARSSGPSNSHPASGSPARSTARSGASPPPLQAASAPRYNMRQRPAVVTPPVPPRSTSRTRASGHAASRASEKAAPPSKKRKITPPKNPAANNGTTTATGRGRKKIANVNESR